MGYPLDMRLTYCSTYFICGSPNETVAGAEPYRKPDVAKAKQLLAEAGYKGEKVVVLVPTDVTYLNAEALMTVQTLRSIGVNVDAQTMDWASIGARRAKQRCARGRRLEHLRHRGRRVRRQLADHQRLPQPPPAAAACPAGPATRSWTNCAPPG